MAWPPDVWRDVNVGVAVSGGADSVALLRALSFLKTAAGGRGELVVVHFDHAARPESAGDARWVAELAGAMGLPSEIGRSESGGPRSEEALRNDRLAFFREVSGRRGLRYLATAHHADDQAETVLFRLLRGSGIDGAAGIRLVARLTDGCSLVRPLLGVRRGDVRAWLATLRQTWREDSSNAEPNTTRNWLRNEVLPRLASRFPLASDALTRFAAEAAEASALIDSLADDVLVDATAEPAEASIPLAAVRETPPVLATAVVRRLWRRAGWPEQAMTRRHWERVVAVASGGGPVDLPGGVRVEASGTRLVIQAR
ncbi:MAG: tRNA lysidine(34) synthetase TilS [Planctomycetota bacterium]